VPPRPREGSELPRFRVGVDVVDVARITRLLADQPDIEARLFTTREIEYCRGKRRRDEHLAGRFAVKEAVLKSFGTGLGTRMRWTDVEVINAWRGRPRVELHGEVAVWARRRGLHDLDVSLSHTSQLAVGHAITVWGPTDAQEGSACAST
jgi:holo-[acyl-carrier protein] synthase